MGAVRRIQLPNNVLDVRLHGFFGDEELLGYVLVPVAAGKLAEGKFMYSMVLSDDSVKFRSDSSKLSSEAEQRLTDFAEKLKTDNRNVYVEIQGHTDAAGSDATNQRLGEQRAETVRLFMNQHGVPLNRLSTISYGKADSVADNKTKVGRAQNRRVVLIVMS